MRIPTLFARRGVVIAVGVAPFAIDTDTPHEDLKWWSDDGTHPNRIIANSPEPVGGQQRWMDTVVTVTRA